MGWIICCKFKSRTSSHRLTVETGRCLGVSHNERSCSLCNNNQIADETHSVLDCTAFSCIRQNYLKNLDFVEDQILLNFVN